MMAERLQAHHRRRRRPVHLQVVLRQGQPVLGALLSRPRPQGGPAHPRPREGRHRPRRALRRPRRLGGRAGRRDPRRAPGAGLPVPADGPAPRVRAKRPARQREEGTVPRPARHGQCRREDPLRRERGHLADGARDELRLQQPRGGLPGPADHARLRLSRDLRRHALGAAARAGRATARAASASTSRPSPAPPSRWAWTRCSWRSTRTPTARSPDGRPLSDGPNMLRLDDLPRLLAEIAAIGAGAGPS